MKDNFKKGQHPNSLANLKKTEGRPSEYEANKKVRSITVTDAGWKGLDAIAKKYGCSRSDLMERIGRGEIEIKTDISIPA